MEKTNEARRAAARGPDARAGQGSSGRGQARAVASGRTRTYRGRALRRQAATHAAQTQEAVRPVVQEADRRSTTTDRRGTVMKTKFIRTLVSITLAFALAAMAATAAAQSA